MLLRSFSTVRQWHQTSKEPDLSGPGCVIVVWKAFSTCIDFPIWQKQLVCDEWLKEQKMYGCQNSSIHSAHNSTSDKLYIHMNKQHMFSLLQVSQPLVLFTFLSSLVWQIYNELYRKWQMLVLCHDPKQPPTTARDWPSILLYLFEWERLSETEMHRERERGGPEEMFCPIRLMLKRPSAFVHWNASHSHVTSIISLCTHCYASTWLSCLKCAEMTEMRRVVEVEWVYEC